MYIRKLRIARNVSESIVPATELANVQNLHITHQATTDESSVVAKSITIPIFPNYATARFTIAERLVS